MNDTEIKEWQTQSVKHKVAMVLMLDGVSFTTPKRMASYLQHLNVMWRDW